MVEKKIKFISNVSDDTEQLLSDFTVSGQLFFNENKELMRIVFIEPTENELTLETTIWIDESGLKIVREGYISMAQTFVLDEAVHGTYETEYGFFETKAYTNVLEIIGDENEGSIYLVYDFYLNEERVSVITLTIEYE